MYMSYSNGQIPRSALKKIPGGYLEENAANAWLDLRAYIHDKTGLLIAPGGPASSYRDLAEQRRRKQIQLNGGPIAAAVGTSNHGWGKAVDEPVYSHQQAILKYGPKFGWSHAEGASVGENWHFTYVGGNYKRKVNPLATLTKEEQGWVREYIKLKKANKNRARRIKLRRVLRQHRKAVYKKAQKHGWSSDIKKRFSLLKRYS